MSPIKIPWSRRYRRWRDRFVPVVAFAVCAAIMLMLWDRHTSTAVMIGEVEAVRAELSAPMPGVLVNLTGKTLDRFDAVYAGQVIARLDDRPTLAALATLHSRLAQSRSEIAATASNIQLARSDVEQTAAIDLAELILDVQRQRLDIVDRRGVIETDRIELQRLSEEYDYVKRLHEQQAETDFVLRMAMLRRDVLARQITEHEQALSEADAQLAESMHLLEALPDQLDAELNVLLQPLRDAVDVHEAEMRELELRVGALQIRAPFAGEVAAVHVHPGQSIVPGVPIITLADPTAQYMVVYFRERGLFMPELGMTVSLYSKRDRATLHESTIVHVGAHVELVPEHHRAAYDVPEWGVPVRIKLPQELQLRPGELVGVLISS